MASPSKVEQAKKLKAKYPVKGEEGLEFYLKLIDGDVVKRPVPKRPRAAKREGSLQIPGKSGPSTHLYSSGNVDNQPVAFPTLFQTDEGNWYSAADPVREAIKRGELIPFNDDADAKRFAMGAWKPLTKMNPASINKLETKETMPDFKNGGELPKYFLGGGFSDLTNLLTKGYLGLAKNGAKVGQASGMLGNFLGGKTGNVLGSVGTGLSIGSMFPGLGTVIGGAGGLALGLGRALLGKGGQEEVEAEAPVPTVPIDRVPGTTGVGGQGYYAKGGPLLDAYINNPGMLARDADMFSSLFNTKGHGNFSIPSADKRRDQKAIAGLNKVPDFYKDNMVPQYEQMPDGSYRIVGWLPAQYEVEGGEVVQGQNVGLESSKQLGPGLFEVTGAKHKGGGVKGTATGGRVFSNRLSPTKRTSR